MDLDTTIPDAWNEGEVSAGSTDVSDVSWHAPTMEFSTSSFAIGTPGHSWQNAAFSGMSIGHKSLIFAAKVIAMSALDLLTQPETLRAAQGELKERLGGRAYKSPVPPEAKPPLDQWTEKP